MVCGSRDEQNSRRVGLREVRQRTWLESPGFGGSREVLHGESNTGQASPRKTIQRMCQPQEAEDLERCHTVNTVQERLDS